MFSPSCVSAWVRKHDPPRGTAMGNGDIIARPSDARKKQQAKQQQAMGAGSLTENLERFAGSGRHMDA
ncbi:MAG: hypothetical protein AMXMBFR4_27780 [Candidatus Hydrogenedentota bacterium]